VFLRRLTLKNWRNFRKAEIDLIEANYVLGPNASGKSNLLDALRFLRDVSKAKGGGLQQALELRGGVSKVRCLHHRQDSEVAIEVGFSESASDTDIRWSYRLAFTVETRGKRRPLVRSEQVIRNGEVILSRPDRSDAEDALLLTETHLEQSLANRKFRPIVSFLAAIRYLHLVPQLIKYSEQIGGAMIETDPFGQSFLDSIAEVPEKSRASRLKRIGQVLAIAVPQLQELRFERDTHTGRPHLEVRYDHWRPNAGRQREDEFSDGTLRLIGLLWLLQEGDGMLLLEEPELSLDEGVVQQLPYLFSRILKQRKKRTRQLLMSTHSEALLSNEGIDPAGVSVIQLTQEGSRLRPVDDAESGMLDAGFSVADAVLPAVHPERLDQLPLDF